MTVTDLALISLLLTRAVMRGIQASQQGGLRPVGRTAWCEHSDMGKRMSMSSKWSVNDVFVETKERVRI